MKNVLIFCLVMCFGILTISAQAQTSHRFFFSSDGQEVLDSKTNLIWRRCVEGMEWDGTKCSGFARTYTHEVALLRSAILVSRTGIAWRLPKEKEIYSIANKSGISPEIFSSTFPDTPPSWFWTSSPVDGTSDHFLSIGFCDDASGATEVKISSSHYVRLVRDGQ